MFEKFRRVLSEKAKVSKPIKKFKSRAKKKVAGTQMHPMYRVVSCQSSGKERKNNEDSLLTFECVSLSGDIPISLGIYIIADGMGGHQSGEVASCLATQSIGGFLLEKFIHLGLFETSKLSDKALEEIVMESFSNAQSRILQEVPGGGTTLTLVLALNDRLISAHIGDSRLYVINELQGILLRTKDHSLVRRLVELGEISESEMLHHPQRNVLYRAMGQDDPLAPDVDHFSIQIGDLMMLCSDGLWGVLDDQEILDKIKQEKQFNDMANQLVSAANDLGGPDNISVILVERLR